MKTIFIVSDGTGARGHHLLRAALAQFPEETEVNIQIRPSVRSLEELRQVVEEACESDVILVHTFAPNHLRTEVQSLTAERGIPVVDLFGHLLTDLGQFLGARPEGISGGVHQPKDRKMVDALTFAVKHDDGLGIQDIRRADIVLVGVSRTSKTPLSVYLAVRGFRSMNVPIVAEVGVPSELFSSPDQGKIVGLKVEPERLWQLRLKRLKKYGRSATKDYTSIDYIRKEVALADDIFRDAGWPVVDVTDRALEEAAVDVIRLTTTSDLKE